jgi:hypothetical protein
MTGMTDQVAALEDALDRVVQAARAHLAAVRAAAGRVDDDDLWDAYVALNNASFAYDDALLETYGEVTPWNVEAIEPDGRDDADLDAAVAAGDPYPMVISVRERRDYRVPSVSALLRAAEAARHAATGDGAGGDTGGDTGGGAGGGPVSDVGQAVLELLRTSDDPVEALDVPALEPLDAVVTVTEVAAPLDVAALPDGDGAAPFRAGPDDRLVGRLDEPADVDLSADGS